MQNVFRRVELLGDFRYFDDDRVVKAQSAIYCFNLFVNETTEKKIAFIQTSRTTSGNERESLRKAKPELNKAKFGFVFEIIEKLQPDLNDAKRL